MQFFQEHNLRGQAIAKTKAYFTKNGWTMQCGPCDESTRKPNAGVGAAQRDKGGVRVVQGQRNTEEFQKAWEAGRAEKYEVDLGGRSNMLSFVLYGK